MDEELVPLGSVLVQEEDGFAFGVDAGFGAGGLDLHEGDEAVGFGFCGDERGEDAAQAEGFFAEGRAEPVVAGGGGVAFVEDEVDDFEDGGEAGFEFGAAWDFEGDAGFGEGAFGADDALAMVGSGRRNARAISSVVRPPSMRRVRASWASVERIGWQEMKMRRRRSSPTLSSIAVT